MKGMWVRQGSLIAGSPQQPYKGDLTFEMLGKENDMWYWFNPGLMGNKVIGVSGNLSLYGVTPATTWSYLQSFAYAGDTTIVVSASSGWKVGDQLLLGPSFSSSSQH